MKVVTPFVKANWLASPPLVVAYAIFGTMLKDITKEPLGYGNDEKPIFLNDIWPSSSEIKEVLESCLKEEMFSKEILN